jgi:hypothetical protein
VVEDFALVPHAVEVSATEASPVTART